jgi:hypothetical protein
LDAFFCIFCQNLIKFTITKFSEIFKLLKKPEKLFSFNKPPRKTSKNSF